MEAEEGSGQGEGMLNVTQEIGAHSAHQICPALGQRLGLYPPASV